MGPVDAEEAHLHAKAPEQSGADRLERHHECVAFGLDFVAADAAHLSAEKQVVQADGRLHAGVGLPEQGGVLDVGEHQSKLADRRKHLTLEPSECAVHVVAATAQHLFRAVHAPLRRMGILHMCIEPLMEEPCDGDDHDGNMVLGAVRDGEVAQLLGREAWVLAVHAGDVDGHLVREKLPQLCVCDDDEFVRIDELDAQHGRTGGDDRRQLEEAEGARDVRLVVYVVAQRDPALSRADALRLVAIQGIVPLAEHTDKAASSRKHSDGVANVGNVQRAMSLVCEERRRTGLPQMHVARRARAPAPKHLLRRVHVGRGVASSAGTSAMKVTVAAVTTVVTAAVAAATHGRLGRMLGMHTKNVLRIQLVQTKKCAANGDRD